MDDGLAVRTISTSVDGLPFDLVLDVRYNQAELNAMGIDLLDPNLHCLLTATTTWKEVDVADEVYSQLFDVSCILEEEEDAREWSVERWKAKLNFDVPADDEESLQTQRDSWI